MSRRVPYAACRRGAAGSFVTLVVAVCVVLAFPRPAAACSCDVPPSLEDEVAGSAAVFTGTVVETRFGGRGGDGDLVATMVVEQVFKGDVAENIEVATAADGGLCGLGFGSGERWLLYAGERPDGSFSAHDCGRSAVVAYADEDLVPSPWAEEDLAELGVGEEPRPGQQLRPDPPLPWGTILGVAAMLVVIGAAVLLSRVAWSGPDTGA